MPWDEARLRFGGQTPGQPFAARQLLLSGNPAFELSLWCGTCPFLFERKDGANSTLSAGIGQVAVLEQGMTSADVQAVASVASLLAEDEYLPLLLQVTPELVSPLSERDYFSHEQVATWGIDSFWGLPEYPRTVYYRTFETAVDKDEHLYEFVVPMVPPGWNDRARVGHYEALLRAVTTPTAVALSTLDVCQPATDTDASDYYVHWGLTHFLLDGHHKLEAAARLGAPVQLLALVSSGGSLAGAEDLARLPAIRARDAVTRARPS